MQPFCTTKPADIQINTNYNFIKISGENLQFPKNDKSLYLLPSKPRTAISMHEIQELNEQLYKIHLECAASWQNTWYII